MLKAEAFLSQFQVIDGITTVPIFLPDFTLTKPGYNDGGEGHRYIYIGDEPIVIDLTDCIDSFLDVMDFDTEADLANTIAAALTVMLWNHWPGGKPIILATASKSHAGKDTIILFAAGLNGQCSISYQDTDWALERSLVGAINYNPDARVVVIENARLNRRGHLISSAIIERFATDPKPFLFSTGTGPARRRRNDFALAISTNFGTVKVEVKVEDGNAIFSVQSSFGISQATIERRGDNWPTSVTVRLHLKGLENLKITNGKETLKASVSSQDAKVRLWKDGEEDSPLDSKHPYWMEVRLVGKDGEPVKTIPLKDGYFEMQLPKALFEHNPPSITLHWIDFYR